ncbi:MAG TPA: sugar phosphate isomerase/epimerase family protein [Bryobacteraceae bacterium]|nr:sugar phosphate isomerase/epimerase family protein [Bryobacteraceae bacterium]
MTRREVLVGTAASAFLHAAKPRPVLCIFSKHLAKLSWDDLGKTAKRMGFEGIDLTVRKGGHVLPERAAEDLPKAVEVLHGHGLSVPMITTELTSGADPTARPILSTASKLKIPRYKIGYYTYKDDNVEAALRQVRASVASLVSVGTAEHMEAGYHNHSGNHVGEAVWDIRAIISDMDPRWIGYYFDPCHATAEGGVYGWHASLDLAVTRLKMMAVKDFYWEKSGGQWKMKMCPLGQGMVDWHAVFGRLAAVDYTGPISLHLEYKPPDEQAAIARDFATLKQYVAQAYGGTV